MCGIIGILSTEDTVPRLLSGLKALEYRGYDSAGIAVLSEGALDVRKVAGKIESLVEDVQTRPLSGTVGIGHSRWATHGSSTVENAHPHCAGPVAVVHNGIIENYRPLKDELQKKGAIFISETDTEVIAHLANDFLSQGYTPEEASFKTFDRLEGAFAVALVFDGHDDFMVCARKGSPLAVGIGDNQMFIGSDALSLSAFTHKLIYLEEDDRVVLRHNTYTIYDKGGAIVERPIARSTASADAVSKGAYAHFMLKEIYEQPQVARQLLKHYVRQNLISLPLDLDWVHVEQVTLVACGTSYYAGQVAQNWFESTAKIAARVEISSEFRYRQPPLPKNGVTIVVSQSGETADTLAALRYAKTQGQTVIALVNVEESSIAREADYVINIMAGPEIGVASTKAFVAQLLIFMLLTLDISHSKGGVSRLDAYASELKNLPATMDQILAARKDLQTISQYLSGKKSILYLGRGAMYGIAMEGALKLKELSYLHAEGAASGELKHGPIALVDQETPIIYLMPDDSLIEKSKSNLEEVLARKGQVILLGGKAAETYKDKVRHFFKLPTSSVFQDAIHYVLPLQILAYETAILEGNDVDQPRNLAKSVTVE